MGGICKLCQKEAELQNSHILPEFFYSEIYDELHRTLAISHNSEKTIQKGLREYLLCQKCETKFSRYEHYAADLIWRIPAFRHGADERFLYSEDEDYSKFKLFQLSLLWRASISKNRAFKQVALGSYQKEVIRQMLDEENPGRATDYGCVMMTMLNTELLHKVIVAPSLATPKPFGHIAYKFVTGNITWLFFATRNPANESLQEFFLQESGVLRIWLARDEMSTIVNLAKTLKRFKGK